MSQPRWRKAPPRRFEPPEIPRSRLEFSHPVLRTSAMAWRIHDNVIRGEIDNREKGVVRGKVWLDGQPDPIVLHLTGNACSDLAGCCLTFTNPRPTVAMRADAVLAPTQRGLAGDLTASRKVRVLDVPIEEALQMGERGELAPEHLANCLYIEWFSEANGRVVIESTDFELQVSAPAWRMSAEDEEQRQRDAASGWKHFLGQLDRAVAQHDHGAKDPEEKWDEHDYERFMRQCDARTDKYTELIDKLGHSEKAHEQIEREMGWTEELTEEEAEEERQNVQEFNAACEDALDEPLPEPDPAREGIDWIRTEDGNIRHPLQHRCFKAAIRFRQACHEHDLSESENGALAEFIFGFRMTGVKLAGALSGIARGGPPRDPAFTVAYLKRALGVLHKAQATLETLASPKKSDLRHGRVPQTVIAGARRELFEIREDILRLMQSFRDQCG